MPFPGVFHVPQHALHCVEDKCMLLPSRGQRLMRRVGRNETQPHLGAGWARSTEQTSVKHYPLPQLHQTKHGGKAQHLICWSCSCTSRSRGGVLLNPMIKVTSLIKTFFPIFWRKKMLSYSSDSCLDSASWSCPTSVGGNSGRSCQARALQAMVHQIFLFLPNDPACSGQEPLVQQILKWRSAKAKTKPLQDGCVMRAEKALPLFSRPERARLPCESVAHPEPTSSSVSGALSPPQKVLAEEHLLKSRRIRQTPNLEVKGTKSVRDPSQSQHSVLLVDLWLSKVDILPRHWWVRTVVAHALFQYSGPNQLYPKQILLTVFCEGNVLVRCSSATHPPWTPQCFDFPSILLDPIFQARAHVPSPVKTSDLNMNTYMNIYIRKHVCMYVPFCIDGFWFSGLYSPAARSCLVNSKCSKHAH